LFNRNGHGEVTCFHQRAVVGLRTQNPRGRSSLGSSSWEIGPPGNRRSSVEGVLAER